MKSVKPQTLIAICLRNICTAIVPNIDHLPKELASKQIDWFVIDGPGTSEECVLSAAAGLRNKGLITEYSFKRTGVGKQMKEANRRGAARALIIYDNEKAAIKDMTTGDQSDDAPLAGVLAELSMDPAVALEMTHEQKGLLNVLADLLQFRLGHEFVGSADEAVTVRAVRHLAQLCLRRLSLYIADDSFINTRVSVAKITTHDVKGT